MGKHASTDNPTPVSDYERVGGGRAVSQVVERFYQLVLADPALASFFTNVDMGRLKRHQVLLISQIMGGPAAYDGRELREAHGGLQISDSHFGRVANHLVASLQEAQVAPDIIQRVTDTLVGAKDDIVTVRS